MIPTPSWAREIKYFIANPFIASAVGFDSQDGTDISSNSKRFAKNTGLVGDHKANSFRHTLQSAIMTVEFGRNVAKKIADTHEDNPGSVDGTDNYDGAIAKNGDVADQTVDLLNNAIGRNVGEANSGLSQKDLAIAVLDEFKNNGLWIVTTKTDQNGKAVITIQKQKLSNSDYNKAKKNIGTLNKNGFTEQQAADKKRRKQNKVNTGNANDL